ncbi:DEAD/DEAH box helicase [Sphingopyxis fribergensis]
MARLSLQSERIRTLVADSIAPLFFVTGSIAGVCKALNAAMAVEGEAVLHPNRIHSLLSDDIGRGVNEATITAIEQATSRIGIEWSDGALKKRKDLARRGAALCDGGKLSLADAAKRLNVPAAILRVALGDACPASSDAGAMAGVDPDWSYQDLAVGRTLDALARRPDGAVGLILPTGGGKSRSALRIAIEALARHPGTTGRVYWATHRLALKAQAARELAKLLADDQAPLPSNAQALAARIEFIMVSELASIAAPERNPPVLVIVDEAHHAAAPSYGCLLDPERPFPLLLLTATPNRPDGLGIGIDEIAFSITYAELANRGSILIPEFIDFPVDNFEWSPEALRDLADYVIDEADQRFGKTLILVSRVDRVEEFHEALTSRLALEPGHRLSLRDIAYVHGGGNSMGLDNEVFLERFRDKPQGIIVSAQLLLEGYDDPAIDAVIMTYESESMIKLMQAAGRAVRHHRGKHACYVVQAHNPEIAYRFGQRWLYQEIVDFLRPDLIDVTCAGTDDLRNKIESALLRHNVPEHRRVAILAEIAAQPAERQWKMLFYGRPYYGRVEDFEHASEWGVFLETPQNRDTFRTVFNAFCTMGAHQSDPSEFVAAMLEGKQPVGGGDADQLRASIIDALTATHFARDQIRGPRSPAIQGTRPYRPNAATSWLRYTTFEVEERLPQGLRDFLAACYNRDAIERAYLMAPRAAALALKLPLPLNGFEATLLDADQAGALRRWLDAVRNRLLTEEPERHFAALAAIADELAVPALPMRLVKRLELFLHPSPPLPLLLDLSTQQEGHDS